MHAMQVPEPTTDAGRVGLAAIRADPARAVVAVDFDGTLAPIVTFPEDARPVPGALQALIALADRMAAVAVVTGRAAGEVIALGGLDAVPGLRVLGHYGLEEWYDGELHSPDPVPAVDEARMRLRPMLAQAPAGVHVEDKRHSLVLHTRPAADPAGALGRLTPAVERLAEELGLEVVPGRMVLELRPPGIDKGIAVRRLLDEVDAAAVLYVGDDLGDLAAFAAVEEARNRGLAGLTVASVDPALDDAPAELAGSADLVVPGPGAVVEFLAALAAPG
jgi:trehalose 6-phosphate phosphatase